jgi:hypothetical protein
MDEASSLPLEAKTADKCYAPHMARLIEPCRCEIRSCPPRPFGRSQYGTQHPWRQPVKDSTAAVLQPGYASAQAMASAMLMPVVVIDRHPGRRGACRAVFCFACRAKSDDKTMRRVASFSPPGVNIPNLRNRSIKHGRPRRPPLALRRLVEPRLLLVTRPQTGNNPGFFRPPQRPLGATCRTSSLARDSRLTTS